MLNEFSVLHGLGTKEGPLPPLHFSHPSAFLSTTQQSQANTSKTPHLFSMVEHCWVAPGLLDRISRECLKPLEAELHLAEVGGQHAVALCNLIVPPGLVTLRFY